MRILLVEDDHDLQRAVKALLEHSGYAVDAVDNGQDALDYAAGGDYDGLILDWMLPGMDGIQILRVLRQRGVATPCLMLTARDAVEDRVKGLDAGADDYLPKPFATSELMARVRSMLRRRADYAPDVAQFGDLTLDRASMTLCCRDRSAKLQNKAYQLMEMLISRPNIIHSVSQIMDRVWGWDSESEINVVWVNISYLRRKLGELGSQVEIRATRGVGYSLEMK